MKNLQREDMSTFIKKLKKVSYGSMRPMGFGEQKENEELKPLLVFYIHEPILKKLSEDFAGADAILLDLAGIKKEELKEFISSSGRVAWGSWLEETGSSQVKQAEEAGFDFIAFDEGSALGSILENGRLGRIIKLDASLDESLLKIVGGMPVDAVLLSGDYLGEECLKWHHLMLLKRFAGVLPQPLMVAIPENLGDSELKALWDMGVDGFTLELKEGRPVENLSRTRKQIDTIKWPRRHDKSKKGALLPGVGFDKETDE